jgi:hypothetical protein
MVVMFVGLCGGFDSTFRTIPTVGILRGGSFSFPPEPLVRDNLTKKWDHEKWRERCLDPYLRTGLRLCFSDKR